MSIGLLSLLLIVGIIFLLLLGLPLAFTTGSVATLATLFLFGPDALYLIVARVFDMMGNYVLVAVPLFIFMANMMERAGVAEQMYTAIHIWSGRLPGGLAIGTIIACCLMAAMVNRRSRSRHLGADSRPHHAQAGLSQGYRTRFGLCRRRALHADST